MKKMKKIALLFWAACMVVSMAACGNSATTGDNGFTERELFQLR